MLASASAPQGLDRSVYRTYAAALRYFHPGLSQRNADAVAAAIVQESTRAGVDARLVVAIAGVEGTLRRVRSAPSGTQIGNKPAREAVARIVSELAWRIHSILEDGVPFPEALRRTLAERAANRLGKPVLSPQVKRYTDEVLRLYARICGDDEPAAAKR